MNKYTLSNEGIARFRRMKVDLDRPPSKIEGYDILNYLYENGAGTVNEIGNYAGLSWNQVSDKLSAFLCRGYVKGTAGQ